MGFRPEIFTSESRIWNLRANATGATEELPFGMQGASFQISGNFGGATVTLQISNDAVNWFTASDRIDGADVSVTAAALLEVSSGALFVRVATTGGNGSTAIVANLVIWHL